MLPCLLSLIIRHQEDDFIVNSVDVIPTGRGGKVQPRLLMGPMSAPLLTARFFILIQSFPRCHCCFLAGLQAGLIYNFNNVPREGV